MALRLRFRALLAVPPAFDFPSTETGMTGSSKSLFFPLQAPFLTQQYPFLAGPPLWTPGEAMLR